MSQSRPIVFIGLAIAIALVTSLLIYKKLQGAPVEPMEEGANVAVAARDIVWGTKLAPDMIKVVKFPKDSIPEGHFESTDAVKGRITVSNLKTSEPILESKLASSTVLTGGVTAVMSPEKRAMAVRVDDVVGVAGFIKPSDHVDVMVTIGHSDKLFTKLLLENVLVLATGADMEKKGKDDKPSPVSVITLEVTPEEAEKLALATTEGKLRLSLRNPQNSQAVMTTGATVDSLLSSYQLRQAAPVQKAVRPTKPMAEPVEVRLKEQLKQLLPDEKEISVQASNDHLTLSGSVSSVAAQNQALALAQAFAPKKVINLLRIDATASTSPVRLSEDVKIEMIKGTSVSNVKFSPQATQ